MNEIKRCSWAKTKYYIEHHDNHWGKPLHNDCELFELLCLEAQSSGLGFNVILSKRTEYEKAFNFKDIKQISCMSETDIDNIMNQYNVLKHKNKLISIINNAKAYFKIVNDYGSLDNFFWSKVKYKIKRNKRPIVENQLSKEIAIELKKYGFKFLGSIMVFSYLQAIGIYNDHQKECFLYDPNIK